eukprot:1729125-Amphidinium_carterae.1
MPQSPALTRLPAAERTRTGGMHDLRKFGIFIRRVLGRNAKDKLPREGGVVAFGLNERQQNRRKYVNDMCIKAFC